MGEEAKKPVKQNMHGIILAVIGIIVLIVGLAIATVKGNPLRGSGLGTIAIVIGVVLLLIGVLRLFYKKP